MNNRDNPADDEIAAAGDAMEIPSLERAQDLLRLAAGIVGQLDEKVKTPAEARFVVAHVRDAVDHWRPTGRLDGASQ